MRKEWDEGKEQGGVGGEIRKDIEVWTPNFQTVTCAYGYSLSLTCADEYLQEDCHRTKKLNSYWLPCHLE